MNKLTLLFIAAVFSVPFASTQAEEFLSLEMLPAFSPLHLFWIGSPLKKTPCKTADQTSELNHYSMLKALCSKVNEYYTLVQSISPTRPNAGKKKIFLWKDESLLGGQPFIDSSEWPTECDDIVQVKDVSELFSILDVPDAGLSIDSQQTYDALKTAKDELAIGNRMYSAMVDFLKVLAVYREGGVYFDLQKDFRKLLFNIPTRLQSQLCEHDSVVIHYNTSNLLSSDNFLGKALPLRFFQNHGKIIFPTEIEHSIEGEKASRTASQFINMDFLGSFFPHNSVLKEYLLKVIQNYKTTLKTPLFRLFLGPHFDSTLWVFSLSGPAVFTSVLTQHLKHLVPIQLQAPYMGSKSWLNNDSPREFPTALLHQFFTTSHPTSIRFRFAEAESMAKELETLCWKSNRIFDFSKKKKDMKSRTVSDVQGCYLSTLMSWFDSGSLPLPLVEEMNYFANHFESTLKTFREDSKNICLSQFRESFRKTYPQYSFIDEPTTEETIKIVDQVTINYGISPSFSKLQCQYQFLTHPLVTHSHDSATFDSESKSEEILFTAEHPLPFIKVSE